MVPTTESRVILSGLRGDILFRLLARLSCSRFLVLGKFNHELIAVDGFGLQPDEILLADDIAHHVLEVITLADLMS